jgi:hypothetical protein
MKKLITVLLIIAIAIDSVSATETIEAYGGIGLEFANASGFKAVRLSDYYKYGSSEGSLLLPLGDMNGIGVLLTVSGGAKYELLPSLNVLGEVLIGLSSGGTYSYQVDVGAIYELPFQILSPSFHLGAGANIGFLDYSKGLGTAQTLPGTTPPVILDQGTIRNGDKISFTSVGIAITPLVDAKYEITRELAVGMDLGLQISIFFSNQIYDETQKKSIPLDDKYFYKPISDDLIRESFKPSVSLTGLKTNVHVLYKF